MKKKAIVLVILLVSAALALAGCTPREQVAPKETKYLSSPMFEYIGEQNLFGNGLTAIVLRQIQTGVYYITIDGKGITPLVDCDGRPLTSLEGL